MLADSLDIFHTNLVEACRAHGCGQIQDRAAFLGIFDHNMISGLQQLGIPAALITPILTDLGRRLTTALADCRPFPGIPETFRLQAAQAPVYVVTSNLTPVVRDYLARHGMQGVRDVVGSDRERSKQVKIRALAAQWPTLEPVYVGDTLGDMVEAHAAGARSIAVTWGWHDEERLRRGRPDHVIHAPAELLSL